MEWWLKSKWTILQRSTIVVVAISLGIFYMYNNFNIYLKLNIIKNYKSSRNIIEKNYFLKSNKNIIF